MELFVAGWVAAGAVCAGLTYGMYVGYFQGQYPTIAEQTLAEDRENGLWMAFIVFLLPPLVLLHVVLTSGVKHGLKF